MVYLACSSGAEIAGVSSMTEQIFISYSIRDKEVADAICASLEEAGRKCWITPRDVLPGSDWSEAIIDAISQSRLMVLVYSDSANRSVQIKREVERAGSKGVTILPFSIEDAPTSKTLEYHLSTAHWLDAVSPPLEPHLQYLCEIVSKMVPRLQATAANGKCLRCGAEMAAGMLKCAACGHARPVAPRRLAPVRPIDRNVRRPWWRSLWTRSRVMKSAALFILAAAFFLAGYLWRGVDKNSIEARLNQAESYVVKGEYDRAIEELSAVLAQDPSYAFGYRARGVAYYTRGRSRTFSDDFLHAIGDFKKAIELNPRDSYAFYMMGQAYEMLGEFGNAFESYSRGLDFQPHNSDLMKGQGNTLIQLKNYDRAIEVLSRSNELYPGDQMTLTIMGSAQIAKGNYRDAVESLTGAININPGNPYLYQRRSEAYQKLGMSDEAIQDGQRAVKLQSGQF